MDSKNDFLNDLLASIENLPSQRRVEALEECLAAALQLMDRHTIVEMRGIVIRRLHRATELEPVIHLIDGHLALLDLHSPPPYPGRRFQ